MEAMSKKLKKLIKNNPGLLKAISDEKEKYINPQTGVVINIKPLKWFEV